MKSELVTRLLYKQKQQGSVHPMGQSNRALIMLMQAIEREITGRDQGGTIYQPYDGPLLLEDTGYEREGESQAHVIFTDQ